MNLLFKISVAVQKAMDEFNKPEPYAKGEAFQNYVCHKLFPDSSYELLHRTHGYTVNKERYVGDSRYPDFQFRVKNNKKEFFVEAKYRSTFNQDRVEWCSFNQLRRYQVIDKKTPVIVILGVGEKPSAPSQIFMVAMKDIKYTMLYKSFLKKYELCPAQPVDYRVLCL